MANGIQVCGIASLPKLVGHWKLFGSFLDPDYYDLQVPATITSSDRLVFRFNDVIGTVQGFVDPKRSDVERWIESVENLAISEPNCLLVHCHLGISRSVAAAAIAYAAAYKRELGALPELIDHWSPRPWPNSLMLSTADDILHLGGALSEVGLEVRRRTARRYPEWIDKLAQTHRLPEVDEARRRP